MHKLLEAPPTLPEHMRKLFAPQYPEWLSLLHAGHSLLLHGVGSKKALVDIFGKDEALEIMRKSPMILTCGSELRDLKPDDIRSTASTRQFLDAFKGPAVLALPIAFFAILKVVGGVVSAYG